MLEGLSYPSVPRSSAVQDYMPLVGPARTNRSYVRNHNKWDSKRTRSKYCHWSPFSFAAVLFQWAHSNNSVALSFIYTGKQSGSLWCGFSSAFVHACPTDYFSHNAFFCCKWYYLLWKRCRGTRWRLRDGCPFVIYPAWPKHCCLIMLFIIVSPLILSSFNIISRVIDSGCQQSSR